MGSLRLKALLVALLGSVACGPGAGAPEDGGVPDLDASPAEGDAVLDGGKPDAITGPRCEGDRWVGSAMDAAQIADCAVIGGNLSITGNQLLAVALPQLETVEGFLTVWGNPELERATFPSLAAIGGYLDVSSNAKLGTLALPELRTVNARGLTAAQDALFSDNPLLGCQAHAIAAHLREAGFTGRVRVEPDNPVCSQ